MLNKDTLRAVGRIETEAQELIEESAKFDLHNVDADWRRHFVVRAKLATLRDNAIDFMSFGLEGRHYKVSEAAGMVADRISAWLNTMDRNIEDATANS